MNKNIILCGVGGQGTVLASKLIAEAAIKKGIQVMSAETIGMAQRGGSVLSHLRLGDRLHSPMLAMASADMIIAFEPAEAVRMLPYLREGGYVIVSSSAIIPASASLASSSYNGAEMTDYLKSHVKNLIIVDSAKACADIGSPRVLNMLLLGAAVRTGILSISTEDIKAALRTRLKPALLDMNFRALEYVK